MSNENWAKGEWYVEPNHVYLQINSEHGCIGDVCISGHEFDDGDCVNGKTTVANANLISAAPDLYHLVKEMHERLSELAENQTDREILQDAKETLAKARGEL